MDWTRLTLEFSEVLDEASVPAATAFSVLVGGEARALAGVSVSEQSAVLALALPVSPTDTVSVAYQAPDRTGLQDGSGNAVASFAAIGASNDTPEWLATQGPGLGNLPYASSEAFTPVSWIRDLGRPPGESDNTQYGINVGILLNGYFVAVFGRDSGLSPGGFVVYDVSDPRNIRLVRRIDDPDGSTGEFREAHSLPAARIGDSVYVAVQTTHGIEIWDVTDVNNIHQESRLRLPAVRGLSYEKAVLHTSWQAPYLYVAAAEVGFFIVDTSDVTEPFVAYRGNQRPNPVSPAGYGGTRAGSIFAMGNHLVVTGVNEHEDWSSIDIGDPRNPVLLDALPMGGAGRYYATCFDGRRVYAAPRPRAALLPGRPALLVGDLTDPASFTKVNTGLHLRSRRYCATQDHFLFQGSTDDFRKIDTSRTGAWAEVGRGALGVEDQDNAQVSPMGNLVFIGNDHGTGSAFFVHDANPDLTPPQVVEVSPRDRAANQPLTTRVGVSFTDSVLLESVRSDTVRLLDADGDVVAGTYSVHLGIVNFSPAEPLEPNATYSVQVVAGGVSDYAGNRIGSGFRSTFSTAPRVAVEPIHLWKLADDAEDWYDRNDGTAVGAAFAADGGLRLDGDGDWIKLASSLSSVLSGDASVAFFLSTNQTGNAAAGDAPGLTGREDPAGTDDAYWGWLDDTGRLRLSFGDGDGIQSPQPVNTGEMHHYVLTRDAASGGLAMYRDGVRVAAGTGAPGARDGGGPYDRLGAIEGSGASLAGWLEEVQVFDRVLNAIEVSELFAATNSGVKPATASTLGTVGVTATFEAEALGDGTTTYQWDFGDGSRSAPSNSQTASHTYNKPGHYTVVLTATLGDRVLRYSFVRTVTHPLARVAPTASSTITGSGDLIYVANPDHHTVTAIHRRGLQLAWESRVGSHPRTVAADTRGRAWVAVQGDDKLVCLDLSGNRCGTINTGPGSSPYGVAFVPGTDTGLVTLQGSGEVLRFDASSTAVLSRRAVNAEPRGIAITGDGSHAYVTRLRSTAAGVVTKISASTLATDSDIELRVDTTTVDAEDRARGKPNYLTQVVISPDGRTAWIPSKQDNTLRGTQRDGQKLTHETTVRAITSLVDLSTGQEQFSRRIDFDDLSGAVAVAFSPLGDYAFLALQGSNSIAVVDAYDGAIKGFMSGGTGLAPDGIWIDGRARRAFVSNYTTRSVSVYDIAPVLVGATFEPVLHREIDKVGVERLSAAQLRGLQIFYNARDPRMSRHGYLSCASCHLGGGEDGTVWDFTVRGEGLRNTIALNRPGDTALGRMHWTANFDEIQDFENDIRNAFGGTGFMTRADFAETSEPLGVAKAGRSADLDALAAYVASLDDIGRSPFRTESGAMAEAARGGESLFTELNCQSCHSGVAYTDGQRHDVGTIIASSGTGSGQPLAGIGFKTPTLLGAWRTAPYFHNGSAATLADVVDSRHGGERALSGAERDKLVAYVRSLDRPSEPAGLWAEIANLPASHDGRTTFSFELRFNRQVNVGFRDFENGLLELTGASVARASRLANGNRLWRVHLRPNGTGPVVIVLPAREDCSEAGAVCTEAGEPISKRVAASVQGPAAQARPVAAVLPVASPIREGAPASFTVTLDAVPAEAVWVPISITQTSGLLTGAVPHRSGSVSGRRARPWCWRPARTLLTRPTAG